WPCPATRRAPRTRSGTAPRGPAAPSWGRSRKTSGSGPTTTRSATAGGRTWGPSARRPASWGSGWATPTAPPVADSPPGFLASPAAPPGAPLLAAGVSAGAPTGGAITAADVRPPLTEALEGWRGAGADTSSLGAIDVRIADLGRYRRAEHGDLGRHQE